MEITVDYYKELQLDRAWDTKQIRKELSRLTTFWGNRQNSTDPNASEQLSIIEQVKKNIREAFSWLTKETKRQEYDTALDAAIAAGRFQDEAEEKLVSLLDQARAYYRKGDIKLATQFAKEAVDGKVNDPEAYDLLAQCYFATENYKEALQAVDGGLSIYQNNERLMWLGARTAIVGTRDYEDAQRRINLMLEKTPSNILGPAEQVNLYLYKGDEQMAFDEIDSYTAKNPDNAKFKELVAHNLDTFSNSYYYHDTVHDTTFIADKEAYEKCLSVCTKAEALYSDNYTRQCKETAEYFGNKEWNSWNMDSIKALTLYGLLLLIPLPWIGVPLLLIDVALVYLSFRPYWQINKTYVTGEMGQAEQIMTTIGDYAARFGGWAFRFLIKLFGWLMQLVLWIVSGGPFR